MEEQRTLLDLVLDPVESDRVTAVADLIAHTENKLRRASLIMAGVERENKDAGIARDLAIAQVELGELSAWLTAHWYPLYLHIHPSQVNPAPEAKNEEAKVLH